MSACAADNAASVTQRLFAGDSKRVMGLWHVATFKEREKEAQHCKPASCFFDSCHLMGLKFEPRPLISSIF